MRMPGSENVEVPKAKVVDYLLSTTHTSGRGKATWFAGFGFSAAEWEKLAESLRRHATEHEVAKYEETAFGTRYTIEGLLDNPDGREALARSVWFVEKGAAAPRFVTAYALRRKADDQGT